MKTYNKILTEKQQIYRQYHEAKMIKYKCLTGKEILPSDQSRIIEQAKSNYYPLEKAFEKQIKTIENQGEKQRKTIEEHGKQLPESNTFVGKDSLSPSK